ncbi:glutathione S-transferase family protein [Comamonas sp. GB3 AK4-5]|uniref:glutathione S-transferase family protein n=1 Tax=Comamonas sp. GB3 AK4-5 TaxID=3231487 RepID=UPI00351F4062
MALKLYYSPGACSFAVHVLLEEIGQPFTQECVSIPQGMTSSAGFLRINPKGRVPVLVVGAEVLTELPAILLYLALRHPEGNWLPTAHPMALARCAEWFNWLSGTVHTMAVGQVWQAGRFIGEPCLEAQVEAKGRINLTQAFERIEGHLSREPYAVGRQYSAVDPYLHGLSISSLDSACATTGGPARSETCART